MVVVDKDEVLGTHRLGNTLGNKMHIVASSPKFHNSCTHFHSFAIDPIDVLAISSNKQTLVSHCG
jgi:hypothetical protein